MKINRQDLKEAFLFSAFEEFDAIPEEKDIDHSFTPQFEEKIKRTNKKSEKSTWRGWHAAKRRIVAVAAIVAVSLTLVAYTPVIKNFFIEYFIVDNGESYGITFDSEQAASAPDRIEEFWFPTFNPNGYERVLQKATALGTTCIWQNEKNEMILYKQYLIHKGSDGSNWIGIDAENTERTSEKINEYKVEVLTNQTEHHLVAVWTDNSYLYMVNISNSTGNELDIVKAIMDSLISVDVVEPIG